MVLCTRIYTFVSYRILNMKRKDTKSKALSSCFRSKSILLYLGGARFEPCLFPFVCTQIFLGYYFHYILILYLRLSFSSYFQHVIVHGWPSPLSHCTFSISSIPYNFHAIAENLHDIHPHQTARPPVRAKKRVWDFGKWDQSYHCTSVDLGS